MALMSKQVIARCRAKLQTNTGKTVELSHIKSAILRETGAEVSLAYLQNIASQDAKLSLLRAALFAEFLALPSSAIAVAEPRFSVRYVKPAKAKPQTRLPAVDSYIAANTVFDNRLAMRWLASPRPTTGDRP